MPGTIGPLLPSDERFDHQIVDTFASVAQTDLAWTEKVCGMACAKDGSLQIGFGFGKYTNRNVMDAYGGISRGVEQRTVRASRRLSPDPETMRIGPLSYEVLEPLQKVRVRLEPTPHQPIAFELLFEGAVPCFLEEPRGLARAARLPPAGAPDPVSPDRDGLGLGRGRGQAHRDHARRVGLDARPLLGRAARRRHRAGRPRARRPPAEPVGARALEPGADAAPRRHALRDPPLPAPHRDPGRVSRRPLPGRHRASRTAARSSSARTSPRSASTP